MKNFSKSVLTKFMSGMVLVTIGITVVVLVLLPFVVERYLSEIGVQSRAIKNLLVALLYPCGVMAVLTEWEVFRIFRSLNKNNPFIVQNVLAFKRIAIYLFVIAAVFITKIIMLNSLMTMFGAFAFAVIGLLMLVLSDVFHQAVVYKEDNDLTI